jgi:predicted porin
MKKSLLALAALGFIASSAHAQTAVTVYGAIDIGIVKAKDKTTALGRGDNNKLGFKGTEDLGGGLSALFQLEMRYEPDTGTTEASPNRPLFQGQSRVGLKGDFGMIRLGRGLSAAQEVMGNFEPWSFDSNRANLVAYTTAGFNGDPLVTGSSQNRFSNGVFYNTPTIGGFSGGFSIATKEAIGNGTPYSHPVSVSGSYANGPFAGTINYERNALETKFWNFGASFVVAPGMKLIGTYANQKIVRDITKAPFLELPAGISVKTDSYVLGGQFTVGSGVILAGYGHSDTKTVGTSTKTRQFSLGYEHNLSKRTFLYTDWFNNRVSPPVGGSITNYQFDVGVHHNF